MRKSLLLAATLGAINIAQAGPNPAVIQQLQANSAASMNSIANPLHPLNPNNPLSVQAQQKRQQEIIKQQQQIQEQQRRLLCQTNPQMCGIQTPKKPVQNQGIDSSTPMGKQHQENERQFKKRLCQGGIPEACEKSTAVDKERSATRDNIGKTLKPKHKKKKKHHSQKH